MLNIRNQTAIRVAVVAKIQYDAGYTRVRLTVLGARPCDSDVIAEKQIADAMGEPCWCPLPDDERYLIGLMLSHLARYGDLATKFMGDGFSIFEIGTIDLTSEAR